ncbi:hypothetical protein P7_188 [Pectobacterium phage vB_PcaM_P7_Pc]|nr:hypothetical protein P7_188 [Pectobacterium phage vB_PcaM_P7_Pc]
MSSNQAEWNLVIIPESKKALVPRSPGSRIRLQGFEGPCTVLTDKYRGNDYRNILGGMEFKSLLMVEGTDVWSHALEYVMTRVRSRTKTPFTFRLDTQHQERVRGFAECRLEELLERKDDLAVRRHVSFYVQMGVTFEKYRHQLGKTQVSVTEALKDVVLEVVK